MEPFQLLFYEENIYPGSIKILHNTELGVKEW